MEMGEVCDVCGEEINLYRDLIGKREGQRPLWRYYSGS